jgi:hypothetical protein
MLIVHYPHYQRIAIYKPIDSDPDPTYHNTNHKIVCTHILIKPELSHYIPNLLPHLPHCPIFLQTGPTCGLHALKSIKPELDIQHLLECAQNMAISERGEIFCVHDLAKLAQANGIESIVVPIDQMSEYNTYKCILVPFDVDHHGVSFYGGKNAHWGIVWKRFLQEDLVIMTHSSCPYYLIEKWSTVVESNKQLKESTVRINEEWIHQIDNCCLCGYIILIL